MRISYLRRALAESIRIVAGLAPAGLDGGTTEVSTGSSTPSDEPNPCTPKRYLKGTAPGCAEESPPVQWPAARDRADVVREDRVEKGARDGAAEARIRELRPATVIVFDLLHQGGHRLPAMELRVRVPIPDLTARRVGASLGTDLV